MNRNMTITIKITMDFKRWLLRMKIVQVLFLMLLNVNSTKRGEPWTSYYVYVRVFVISINRHDDEWKGISYPHAKESWSINQNVEPRYLGYKLYYIFEGICLLRWFGDQIKEFHCTLLNNGCSFVHQQFVNNLWN